MPSIRAAALPVYTDWAFDDPLYAPPSIPLREDTTVSPFTNITRTTRIVAFASGVVSTRRGLVLPKKLYDALNAFPSAIQYLQDRMKYRLRGGSREFNACVICLGLGQFWLLQDRLHFNDDLELSTFRSSVLFLADRLDGDRRTWQIILPYERDDAAFVKEYLSANFNAPLKFYGGFSE